jgi:hypothetical protein
MTDRTLHALLTTGTVGSTDPPVRGFMLDSARCQENRDFYRKFIDFAANRGTQFLLWHFTDDQGCSLVFDSVPGIASPHAYTKTEMRELIAYARMRGVEIIPELASLGHCTYITRLPAYHPLHEGDERFTGMCPVSDQTRGIIRDLIHETIDLFDSPNFHVGMDEVNIGSHPLTRVALENQSYSDLMADYILFLHGIVTAKNRRMWMWGDGLLKHPDILKRLPRDIVICNWQYRPDASPLTTQTLLDAGFDVMLTSSMINHDQMLFPGDQFAASNIRTLQSQIQLTATGAAGGKILGHLCTIWTPVRFIADSIWAGVDLAAAIMHDGPAVSPANIAEQFGKSFYGLNRSAATQFADVVRLLLEHSPARKQWLAVAKCQPISEPMLNRVLSASKAWTIAHDLLSEIAPQVRDHQAEFYAFKLLVELLQQTHAAAVHLADPAVSSTTIAEMIRRGQKLVDRISAQYDRERYGDDPRKFTAPLPRFQDEHLIPLLQSGLAAMKNRFEESGVQVIINPGAAAITSPACVVKSV